MKSINDAKTFGFVVSQFSELKLTDETLTALLSNAVLDDFLTSLRQERRWRPLNDDSLAKLRSFLKLPDLPALCEPSDGVQAIELIWDFIGLCDGHGFNDDDLRIFFENGLLTSVFEAGVQGYFGCSYDVLLRKRWRDFLSLSDPIPVARVNRTSTAPAPELLTQMLSETLTHADYDTLQAFKIDYDLDHDLAIETKPIDLFKPVYGRVLEVHELQLGFVASLLDVLLVMRNLELRPLTAVEFFSWALDRKNRRVQQCSSTCIGSYWETSLAHAVDDKRVVVSMEPDQSTHLVGCLRFSSFRGYLGHKRDHRYWGESVVFPACSVTEVDSFQAVQDAWNAHCSDRTTLLSD